MFSMSVKILALHSVELNIHIKNFRVNSERLEIRCINSKLLMGKADLEKNQSETKAKKSYKK